MLTVLRRLQVNASWQSHTAGNNQEVCNGTNALLFTLGRMLMRHTKAQTIGGQAVSKLPPKTEESLAGVHHAGLHAPLPQRSALVRRLLL